MTREPEFAELQGLGISALKFTLERMAKGDVRVQWFPLLKIISGSDPVAPDKRGFIPEMAKAWLTWGRRERYLET
jgi:hypothetical protein